MQFAANVPKPKPKPAAPAEPEPRAARGARGGLASDDEIALREAQHQQDCDFVRALRKELKL